MTGAFFRKAHRWIRKSVVATILLGIASLCTTQTIATEAASSTKVTTAFKADASSDANNAELHNVARPTCRSGVFLDAIILMNSSMRAYNALTATDAKTNNIATAEISAIMSIALKQAAAEYHCIESNLPLSYAKNYGDTLRAAIETAKQMRISAATINASRGVLVRLESVSLKQTDARERWPELDE
jgi:hypothetical protein